MEDARLADGPNRWIDRIWLRLRAAASYRCSCARALPSFAFSRLATTSRHRFLANPSVGYNQREGEKSGDDKARPKCSLSAPAARATEIREAPVRHHLAQSDHPRFCEEKPWDRR
jgi:hypothetical protein